MSIRIQEQVLFELAMAMGTSLDLEQMLSTALSTYLRRLCCMKASVYINQRGEENQYENIFSIPRIKTDNIAENIFLEKINSIAPDDNDEITTQNLPIHLLHEGTHYYLMELPRAGFLMIGKGQTPLSQSMLKSLHKLNIKFAESILSCLTHRNNEILNMKLKNQIRGRKKAEEKLLAERKKYRIIFENSPIGTVYYNHQGVIMDCNQKFIEIMGLSRENLIGFNSATDTPEKMRKVINKALNGELSTYEGDYTSVTGGRTMYLRTSFNPVITGSDETEVIATVEEVDPAT